MKVLPLIPVFAFVGTLFANGQPPAQSLPVDQSKNILRAEYYVGMNAGFQQSLGKKKLFVLDGATSQSLFAKNKIKESNARLEFLMGASWPIQNTPWAMGVEINGSYSPIKSKDRNTYLILGITSNEISNKWESKFAYGIDLKPVYNMSEKHSIYGLLGVEFKRFKFTLSDDGKYTSSKTLVPFNWGLGYEYRMGRSFVGLRYKNQFARKSFVRPLTELDYKFVLRPQIHSVMITYRYSFM